MTHGEFVEAYRSGAIRVNIDRDRAARDLSGRLLLPLVMMPVLGTGIALALIGRLWTGFALIVLATVTPKLIKRSAPHFVLTHALQDATFYEEVTTSELLKIVEQ